MALFKKSRRSGGLVGFANDMAALSRKMQKDIQRKQAAEMKAAQAATVRTIEPAPFPSAPFPLGVGDMHKLTTTTGGKQLINYVFQDRAVADRFIESLHVVNVILGEASELSGHEFGQITTCVFTVPSEGWGFTRAVFEPVTRSGNPSAAPMKVYFETSPVPCSDMSYSGLVHYNPSGEIKKVAVTHYVKSYYAMKMQANRVRGTMKVKSVVLLGSTPDEGEVWYSA